MTKTPSSPSPASSPQSVYTEGLRDATGETTLWSGRARLVSNARLLCFVAILVSGWMAFGTRSISPFWVALPVAFFVALLIAHERILRREARATRMLRFYEDGLARLADDWVGRGDSGDRYLDPKHPYAPDLDVFGRGSLFELMSTTRTQAGSDRLADWLSTGGLPQDIRERQEAVQELTPRLSMRLEMALAGDEAGSITQREALETWAAAPSTVLSRAIFYLAIAATSLSVGGILLWIFSGAGPVPFALALILQGAFAFSIRSRVRPVLVAADTPVGSLARTGSLLACVEDETFESKRLRSLRAELETTGHSPSAELEGLRRLVDRRDARHNQFFAPVAALLMWGTHAALALEKWRARCGPRLAVWIDTAGEIEALCAVAGYAYEHPDDPYPEIIDAGPVFDGVGLAHPLLPAEQAVRNNLSLGSSPQALVMSGSNMSGKSTMLRTVGCNTILAMMGAPVRAESLRISPLRIAASIRIVDSLHEGQSHFMAEIMRLRQVVEISRSEPPALFLLDEILHGTNSHDRRIGAEAVLKGLVAHGALGIVTTHDLALTQIVPPSEGRLDNVHFEDHLEGGHMHFDYKLREGIVEKSNALELMRSVGLDV